MAVKFNINIKELKKITRKLNIDLNNKTQRLSESVKDLQDKIKSKVKETTDLEVKQVNITVKKAVQEKQKTEA